MHYSKSSQLSIILAEGAKKATSFLYYILYLMIYSFLRITSPSLKIALDFQAREGW